MAQPEIQYPILIWADTDAKTELVLKDNASPARIINSANKMSVLTLIAEISRITGIEDLVTEAVNGDELFFAFNIVEFPEDIIIWKTLLTELETEVGNYQSNPDATVDVQAELNRFYRLDLASSALETVYASVIYYLARLGNELAVNSLGISGNLAHNNRFIKLLTANLGEDYVIVLL